MNFSWYTPKRVHSWNRGFVCLLLPALLGGLLPLSSRTVSALPAVQIISCDPPSDPPPAPKPKPKSNSYLVV